MSQSQILRIPSGYLNSVNNAVVGEASPPPYGPSPFQGQLGKWIDLDVDAVRALPANGVVLGGRFQSVILSSISAVPVVGQIAFRDTTVDQSHYQVTADETLSSVDQSIFTQGIFLTPNITPGYETIIQIPGPNSFCYVMMRAVLTDAGAIGSRIYAAAAGGADTGFADVLDDGTAATIATVSLMQGRFIGKAINLPVGGQLCLVQLLDF